MFAADLRFQPILLRNAVADLSMSFGNASSCLARRAASPPANPWRKLKSLSILLHFLFIGMGIACTGMKIQAQITLMNKSPGKGTGGDIRAGDTVTLTFNPPVLAAGKPEVTVDDNKPAFVTKVDVDKATNLSSITFKTPDSLTKGDHPVKVTLDGKELAASLLTVYPTALPTLTKIYPEDVKPDALITVVGTGLAGPSDKIKLHIGATEAETVQVDRDGNWFVARFNANDFENLINQQNKDVVVTAWDVVATPQGTPPPTLNAPSSRFEILKIFLIAVAVLSVDILFIRLLFQIKRNLDKRSKDIADAQAKKAGAEVSDPKQPRGFIASLIYEQGNNTLSLSKAQLVWWLFLIGYGYSFLWVAQFIVRHKSEIPALGSFAYTFLISLATLVASQVTTAQLGAKGAGPAEPGWSDLITNGGAVALEKVQQLFWTVLIGIIFIVTIILTYKTATALPTIPNELLALMGVSSAGYIAGKAFGNPGPIISQVLPTTANGSVTLKIYGIHLSMGRINKGTDKDPEFVMPQNVGARILVDNVPQAIEKILTLEVDPDRRDEFAKVLQVELPASTAIDAGTWLSTDHTIHLTNADGQSAEFKLAGSKSSGGGEQSNDKQSENDPAKPDQPVKKDDAAAGTPGAASQSEQPGQSTGQTGDSTTGQQAQPGAAQTGNEAQTNVTAPNVAKTTQDVEDRIPAAPGDPGGGSSDTEETDKATGTTPVEASDPEADASKEADDSDATGAKTEGEDANQTPAGAQAAAAKP